MNDTHIPGERVPTITNMPDFLHERRKRRSMTMAKNDGGAGATATTCPLPRSSAATSASNGR